MFIKSAVVNINIKQIEQNIWLDTVFPSTGYAYDAVVYERKVSNCSLQRSRFEMRVKYGFWRETPVTENLRG